mmetsp:Transcript_8831/g.25158  ORF Transcript_8831/g.25158 Transcript_8831/m.25158 type:complete len:227 (+) Transcript_8831:206-886(+)
MKKRKPHPQNHTKPTPATNHEPAAAARRGCGMATAHSPMLRSKSRGMGLLWWYGGGGTRHKEFPRRASPPASQNPARATVLHGRRRLVIFTFVSLLGSTRRSGYTFRTKVRGWWRGLDGLLNRRDGPQCLWFWSKATLGRPDKPFELDRFGGLLLCLHGQIPLLTGRGSLFLLLLRFLRLFLSLPRSDTDRNFVLLRLDLGHDEDKVARGFGSLGFAFSNLDLCWE